MHCVCGQPPGAICELKRGSALPPEVGGWIVPHEREHDLLMTLMKLYWMCNNYSGTQVQVHRDRQDTSSALRSLNWSGM